VTTKTLISEIKDSGLFEELCTSILRKKRPELSEMIHMGTNSAGQTRKAPIDGFTKTKIGDKTVFVSIQHTTDKNLKRKWLSEKTGDIVKTETQLKSLREEFPNADFELILTANTVPNIEDSKEVIAKAKKIDLTVIFLEQSAIAAFLDDDEFGQWLRKKYFNLDYQLLSVPALQELSKKDSESYRSKCFLPPYSEILEREVAINKFGAIVSIVGNSGYGKSAVVYEFWQKALNKNERVFWLDEGIVADSNLFEECLKNKLLKLKSNLYLTQNKLWYEKKFWESTIFIIDDINRVRNKREVLKKIVQWHQQLSNDGWSVTFLLPLWEETYLQVSKDQGYHVNIPINKYTKQESRNILSAPLKFLIPNLDHLTLDAFAIELEHDPLLIGLFIDLISKPNVDLTKASKNTIQKRIDECVSDLYNENNSILKPQIYAALKSLGSKMLEERNFNPTFSDVNSWLSYQSEQIEILRLLVRQGKLISLDEREIYIFRHDRVRDELLASGFSDFKNYKSDWRFKEIYYGYFLAKAIGVSELSANRELFQWLLNENPLSVFEFIRLNPETALTSENINIIKTWIIESLNENHNEAIEDRIKTLLFYTDSEKVLEILPAFARYDYAVSLTGMKNGRTEDAIRLLNYHFETLGHDYFDYHQTVVIERINNRYKEKAIENVKSILSNLDSNSAKKNVVGTLLYASILKAEELIKNISSSWKQITYEGVFAKYFIRAYLSCGGKINSEFWNEMVNVFEKVDDWKFQNEIRYELNDQREIIAKEISYVISKAEQDDYWRELFKLVIEHHGTIECFDFILNTYPNKYPIDVRDAVNGYFDKARPYDELSRIWDPDEDRGKRLPKDIVDFLGNQWISETNGELKRWIAFNVWEHYATPEDLDILRKVEQSSVLFKPVYRLRLRLRDFDCVASFEEQAEHNRYLLFQAHYIWCDEVKQALSSFFKLLKADKPKNTELDGFFVNFSGLFLKIPIQDAEDLLVSNWENIRNYNEFIKIGLFLNSDRLNKLSVNTIQSYINKRWIFRSTHWTFRTNVKGAHQITSQQLERLKPYFSEIDELDLSSFIDPKNKETFEWWRQNIPAHLKSHGRRYFPTDSDLQKEFNYFTSEIDRNHRIDFYLERFVKYGIDKTRILQNLFQWLDSKASIKYHEFIVSCHIIEFFGKRKDILMLEDSLKKVIDNNRPATLKYESTRDQLFLENLQ
jgi:hypothetical protein